MGLAELTVQTNKGKKQRVAVDREVFTIGRGKTCSLKLDDKWVSDEHCRIVHDGAGFRLIDCGSKNGTLLNGENVQKSELKWGDVVHLGQTSIVFIETSDGDDEPNVLIEGEKPAVMEGAETETIQMVEKFGGPSEQQRTRSELSLLHSIVAALGEPKDLGLLMASILNMIIKSTKATRGKIILTEDAERDELIIEDPADAAIHVDARVLEEVIRQREAVLLKRSPESSKHHREYTAICSPIVTRKGVVGAIYLDTDGGREDFQSRDLEFTTTISSIIGMTVGNVREFRIIKEEYDELKRSVSGKFYMVGESPAMRQVFVLIEKAAPAEATVLVTGESGTGKELVARALHALSPRKDGPLEIINCAAIPQSLLESELFGYEKGAFTGAYKTKPGKFEEAHGGSIVLDEISEMDLESQAKLLRVIEQKSFKRIGGSKTITVDIRFIVATNKDLASQVAKGLFREDLYFRLNVVNIHTPPLRERRQDIPLLVKHFLEEHAAMSRKKLKIAPEAVELLERYPWPGNVRELKNAVERAYVLCQRPELQAGDFAFLQPAASGTEGLRSLAEIEKQHILAALDALKGNKEQVAKSLGISRSTLYEKLKNYGLDA